MAGARREALLITQYYRPEVLGSGPFCADLAEWMVQRGWRVTALVGLPHYPDADSFAADRIGMQGREVINGVRVVRVRSHIPDRRSARSRIAGELSFFMAGLWALGTRAIARHDLVISLCPSIFGVALGIPACRPNGRHIAVVHDIQSGLAKGLGIVSSGPVVAAMRLMERAVLNRVDLVSVLTDEMGQQLRAAGVSTPITQFPIWVDLDRFAVTFERDGGPVRVLYSGNLGKKQGLDQVIGMAEQLLRLRPDIEIVVRGRGDHATRLGEAIAERGLANMRLEELLPTGALHRGLIEADIHLVPQAPDAAAFALPSKIYNIMAAGRPFVATARAGSPLWRIQQASNAFVCVPPDDPVAFAHAIVRLADDASLRAALGQRGRAFVADHNARPKVLEAFEAHIERLYAS